MPIRSRRLLPRLLPAAAVVAVAFAAAPAAAQLGAINPFSFGVSGGAVIPLGDFADGAKTGYGVNGLIGLRLPALPVSFRGEVGYSRNDLKNGLDGNTRIISGVANIILGVTPGPTVVLRPYLIGGIGIYNVKGTVSLSDPVLDDRSPAAGVRMSRVPSAQLARQDTFRASDSQSKFGLNGGVGIDLPLPGISTFAEARFVSIFGDGGHLNYVPITVGIRF